MKLKNLTKNENKELNRLLDYLAYCDMWEVDQVKAELEAFLNEKIK